MEDFLKQAEFDAEAQADSGQADAGQGESLSGQRRAHRLVGGIRGVASELRWREGAASLLDPGWKSGSRQAEGTDQARAARAAADVAQWSMATRSRLDNSQMGFGSFTYKIGGVGEHAADRRLTALTALKEQRRKNWWKSGPSEPAKLIT